MKFNIEVEIDWLGEGDNIDDAVKQNIIDGVVEKLSGGLIKKITDDAMDRVNKKLDELVLNLFDSFLESGVTITDGWGKVIKKDIKIEELMKEKLDKALYEKVTKDGITSSYGADRTRLQYMLDSRISKAVEEMTKKVIAEVDAKISKHLNDEVKARLSNSLLEKINVDGIIGNVIKGFRG